MYSIKQDKTGWNGAGGERKDGMVYKVPNYFHALLKLLHVTKDVGNI